jgi:hypothetical protein
MNIPTNREEYLQKTFPLPDGTTYIENLNKTFNMDKIITMREKIKTMSDAELDQFILARLKFDGTYNEHGQSNHLRFEMSGISDPSFKWIKDNRDIWDLFIDCGIYDRVCLFHMDAYKGGVCLFYKWFGDDDYLYTDGEVTAQVIDFTSSGTRKIIKDVLKFFCVENQDKPIRRLD